METWRQKAGILVMLACLGLVLTALWYCLFCLPGKDRAREGTLVLKTEEGGAVERLACQSREGAEKPEEKDGETAAAWPGAVILSGEGRTPDVPAKAAWPGTAVAGTDSGKPVDP